MYYAPNTYGFPYYTNPEFYYIDAMSRAHQEENPEVVEAVLQGIKREATSIDLYRRLASVAPNENHKQNLLQGVQGKKAQLNHFIHLYTNLTGIQPEYKMDKIPFRSYGEGLKKAYSVEVEGFESYRKSCDLANLPHVRDLLSWAANGERGNMTRFSELHHDAYHGIQDYGSQPYVVNIEQITKKNDTFRTALWTGEHLQVTLMSIEVGESIGLEVHPHLDQFLRLEQGEGLVQMGDSKDNLNFEAKVSDDFAIMVPAGKWHNLTNRGNQPLKLYSIYAPPEHPFGTVHETKEIAMAEEEHHDH